MTEMVQALAYRPAVRMADDAAYDGRSVQLDGQVALYVRATCPVCHVRDQGRVVDSYPTAGYAEVICEASLRGHHYGVPLGALVAPAAALPAVPAQTARARARAHLRPTDLRRKARRVYGQGRPGAAPRV